MLLLILAGRIYLRHQDASEYLLTENRVLREKLGKKRILLNDDQRLPLAVKGKILDRKMLERVTAILTPDTILRWYRDLVARHRGYSDRRRATGSPALTPGIIDRVVHIARGSLSLERFMRSTKDECFHRLTIFGKAALPMPRRQISLLFMVNLRTLMTMHASARR